MNLAMYNINSRSSSLPYFSTFTASSVSTKCAFLSSHSFQGLVPTTFLTYRYLHIIPKDLPSASLYNIFFIRLPDNMKSILSFALLLTSSAWASLLEERDEVCEMVWVTVYTDAMPYSAMSAPSAIATGGPGQNATYANIMTSSTQSVSQGNTNTQSASIPSGSSSSSSPGTNGMISTNDVGEVGFPLDGPHLSAPVNDAAVPADVRIYPADSKTISGKALADWMGNQTKTPPPSKWLKIPAGVYSIDCKDTIYFSFMQGLNEGWTMDMRGVTFLVNGICQAIYINQCEDFTIYGGTLWFDGGEMWTQSQITSIDDIGGGYSTVTCVVEKGYNTTTWRDVTPRNLYVMDASDSNHYVRPTGLNFWFASDWNFDKLDSERTWTMKVLTSRVPLKGKPPNSFYPTLSYSIIAPTPSILLATITNTSSSHLHPHNANRHRNGQHDRQRKQRQPPHRRLHLQRRPLPNRPQHQENRHLREHLLRQPPRTPCRGLRAQGGRPDAELGACPVVRL